MGEGEKALPVKSADKIEKIQLRTKGKRGALVYEAKLVNTSERHKLYYWSSCRRGAGRAGRRTGPAPLTNRVIERHLDNFHLEVEFGTHSKIRGHLGDREAKLDNAVAM